MKVLVSSYRYSFPWMILFTTKVMVSEVSESTLCSRILRPVSRARSHDSSRLLSRTFSLPLLRNGLSAWVVWRMYFGRRLS